MKSVDSVDGNYETIVDTIVFFCLIPTGNKTFELWEKRERERSEKKEKEKRREAQQAENQTQGRFPPLRFVCLSGAALDCSPGQLLLSWPTLAFSFFFSLFASRWATPADREAAGRNAGLLKVAFQKTTWAFSSLSPSCAMRIGMRWETSDQNQNEKHRITLRLFLPSGWRGKRKRVLRFFFLQKTGLSASRTESDDNARSSYFEARALIFPVPTERDSCDKTKAQFCLSSRQIQIETQQLLPNFRKRAVSFAPNLTFTFGGVSKTTEHFWRPGRELPFFGVVPTKCNKLAR